MGTEVGMLGQLGLGGEEEKRKHVLLDREHIDRCYAAYVHRPEIRSCVSAIGNRILSRGVEFTRSGMKLDEDFQNHVRKEYGRFCNDVILHACVMGVVPYILRKDPKGLHYPRVLSPQEYDVEMITDARGNRSYALKSDRAAKVRGVGPGRGRGGAGR